MKSYFSRIGRLSNDECKLNILLLKVMQTKNPIHINKMDGFIIKYDKIYILKSMSEGIRDLSGYASITINSTLLSQLF